MKEMMMMPLCTRQARLIGSLKSKLWHISLIPSQPVFAPALINCFPGGEAAITNFIDFGLTRLEFEPTIYAL
jgi:hypothetical protein